MTFWGLAVVLAVVFLVLAAAHVVGWLLALVVAVVAILVALALERGPVSRRRL